MIPTLLPRPAPPARPFPGAWMDVEKERKPRVLMIEDDLTIATMYRQQLRADGFEVELATDGVAGLHAAQANPPDLVLLDIRLPKMSGTEVLRTMASDPRVAGVPVIALSNYSDGQIVREVTGLGAREYLVKSQTTPAELTEKIRKLLG